MNQPVVLLCCGPLSHNPIVVLSGFIDDQKLLEIVCVYDKTKTHKVSASYT